ncbi:dTDP-4-amino-4,6-dideoxygalactose transaminase [Marinobacter sp. DSM 26671]|uniref:DegT/DnrJ/EryC1/StrS family aminotransferase n=1 Tax=Marinobacter sp. DSM 26671 TaxID=1761793 RepID=UPI0008EF9C7A|nr:DegT/DnrJ/EryC1/StrS aminotransferase family protein [Marinobacter sp. DSM 26671]SFE23557.1 dTDP-4-amino-4,6-dideoxygalactose transaminase [Marinobacter sp. DSM 26671]
MLNTTFSPWPSFSQEEADAVSSVLLSNKVNYWTGTEAREFEREFAEFAGTEHAIAVANGTVALDLALRGLEIGRGDEVIVTSRSFLASASCIVNAGAKPVFADVDRDSQNITAETVRPLVSERTKAIIAVHLAGWPCDMDALNVLAAEHGLYLIEDCAQAHGATFKGRSVGGLGHVAAWSFCQDKIMTTGGEGGMVTTNDRELWSRMWSFKDHGKSWDAVYEREHPPGFRWLHESIGTNWRMTEMQAVIGRIQVKRMHDWNRARKANCEKIWASAAKQSGLRVPTVPDEIGHAGYKCYVYVETERLRAGWNRDRIMAALIERGVPCFSGSCSEVYLEKCFQDAELAPAARLPVAKELGETSLMFLVHPTLTDVEMSKTVEVLADVLVEASK